MLKATKAFLSWAAERGLLEANPLAKFKLDLMPVRRSVWLSNEELVAIYEAAQKLGPPWGAMIGLLILTGEAVKELRQMTGHEVDWVRGNWSAKHCSDWGTTRGPVVFLPPLAMELLAPYRQVSGYLFPSPRANFERPINLYREVLERLKSEWSVSCHWGMRDIRRTVSHEIQRLGGGRAGVERWAESFALELARKRGDDDVEL